MDPFWRTFSVIEKYILKPYTGQPKDYENIVILIGIAAYAEA